MGDHEQMTLAQRTGRIRELNDKLRQRHEGRVLMTPGICELPIGTVARILIAIRDFTNFDQRNDPHREHDFGRVVVDEHEILWKIDYYATDLESGSPDPSDDTITCRVMTVMLGLEY